MGFLTAPRVKRVDLGDEFWAEVQELPAGIYTEVQNHMTNTTLVDDQPDVKVDLAAYRMALVTAAVRDWNLTDENGGPLPLTPDRAKLASIRRLPTWAFEELRAAADEINGTRRDRGQFRPGGAEGDPDGLGGAAGVSAVPDGEDVLAPTGAHAG